MAPVSTTINLLFIVTALVTILAFSKAAGYSGKIIFAILFIAALQSVLSLNDFFLQFEAMPPRFIVMILPSVLLILLLFLTKSGKQTADSFSLQTLTLLHTIRIPVEICLHALFVSGLVPHYMTYEGLNFDIISGIAAPLVYYFVFVKPVFSKKGLLVWNMLCLLLLANIVIVSILSAKTPFQQLAFEQPNTGIAYFPFVLLPSVIVPLVAVSHITSIRLLLKK